MKNYTNSICPNSHLEHLPPSLMVGLFKPLRIINKLISILYGPTVSFFLGGGVNRQEREVTLTLKHGVEAKNYDDVSTCLCSLVSNTM